MMPNGKGTLECWYCTHWKPSDKESDGLQGSCSHWQAEIPPAEPRCLHRICVDFSPSEDYERDNRPMMKFHGQTTAESVSQRMSWFGIDLKPGVLYVFEYNNPPGLREMTKHTRDETEAGGDA